MATLLSEPVAPSDPVVVGYYGTFPGGYVTNADGMPPGLMFVRVGPDKSGVFDGDAQSEPWAPGHAVPQVGAIEMAFRLSATPPDPDITGSTSDFHWVRAFCPCKVVVQWDEIFYPDGGGSPTVTPQTATIAATDDESSALSVAAPSSAGTVYWDNIVFLIGSD